MITINTEHGSEIDYMEKRVNEMMTRGIKIKDLSESLMHYTNLRETLREEIRQKYRIDNPNSSQQIARYLQMLANQVETASRNDIIEICYDDKTDKWTTKAEAMEALAELGYDIGIDIIQYREVKKYAETLESIEAHTDNNRLIHPDVKLARTNRISYSNPGLMSIPKELLWDVIRPIHDKGKLYSVDIKNQEPSILANVLGDETLKNAITAPEGLYEYLFKQVFKPVALMTLTEDLEAGRVYKAEELRQNIMISPEIYIPKSVGCNSVYINNEKVTLIENVCQGFAKGVDIIYPQTVRVETEYNSIYNVEVKWGEPEKERKSGNYIITGELVGLTFDIDANDRKQFKTAWNALSYGASSMGVQRICKNIDGMKEYKFFNNIQAYKDYKKIIDNIIKAGQDGITTVFGTPVIADAYTPAQLKRQLLDLPIQGTGADILSMLIKNFDETVNKKGLADKIFIYYTRHDELIIEVDDVTEVDGMSIEEFLNDIIEHKIVHRGVEWIPFKVEISNVTAE